MAQKAMHKTKMFTFNKTEGRPVRAPYGIKFVGSAEDKIKLLNWFASNALPDVEENEEMVFTKEACWLWAGNTQNANYKGNTYSRVEVADKTIAAHRLMYATFYGEVDEYHEVDHLCHNTLCVNPFHLDEVTGAENRRRETSRRKVRKANKEKVNA